MAEIGWIFGSADCDTANIHEYGWDGTASLEADSDFEEDAVKIGWGLKGSAENATYSASYGDLQMNFGDEFVSPVIDRGEATSKFMVLTCNPDTSAALQWRGALVSFDRDSSVLPLWQDFSGGVNTSYQYIQAKIKCVDVLAFVGDTVSSLEISGQPIGIVP